MTLQISLSILVFWWLTYSIVKYWQLSTYGFKFTCKWNFFLRVLHIVKWTGVSVFFFSSASPQFLNTHLTNLGLPYHLWNNPAIVQMITMIVDKLITWNMKSLRVFERERVEENGIFYWVSRENSRRNSAYNLTPLKNCATQWGLFCKLQQLNHPTHGGKNKTSNPRTQEPSHSVCMENFVSCWFPTIDNYTFFSLLIWSHNLQNS